MLGSAAGKSYGFFMTSGSKAVRRAPSASSEEPGAEPRTRRTQAERTAETRARLIEGAITCLHRMGYAETTTAMVAQEAGVSRGRLTHHYPNKIDLMEDVVREVYQGELEEYDRLFSGKAPKEVFYDFPDATWAVLSRPAAMAVTEIMMATRSDPELAERLRAVQAGIEASARSGVVKRLAEAGITERPDGSAIHRLFVAAARGLAIDALFTKRPQEIQSAVNLMKEILRLLYPDDAPPDGRVPPSPPD